MKKLLFLLLFLLPNVGHAAIAFDASAPAQTANSTSLTWSHTTSGANRILWVAIMSGSGTITGVTYAGTAMTQGATQNDAGDGLQLYLYYLIAPTTGANNVVVSRSPSGNIWATSSSYTGAAQSGQPYANVGTPVTTGTSLTQTLTTVADNSWTVGIARDQNLGQTPTAGAGTTIRTSSALSPIFDSNSPKTPAGSTSLITNYASNSLTLFGAMVSFSPAASAPPSIPSLLRTLLAPFWIR